MVFNKITSKPMVLIATIALILILVMWVPKLFIQNNSQIPEPIQAALSEPKIQVNKNTTTRADVLLPQVIKQGVQSPSQEDVVIQEQLDRDREQQKHTKDLKFKLEQTNIELEQEKALTEINKLKKENTGAFNEPATEGQNNLPEIIVNYIGGDDIKKEAIISIGGTNYQIKDKSNPTDNIQVISISKSSVTLHFDSPQNLTKTYDYKPD